MVSCDFTKGKYVSMALLVEGLPKPSFQDKIATYIKRTDLRNNLKRIYFEEHIKQSLRDKTNIIQLSHHTTIKHTFQRIVNEFRELYGKRGFVHWYVGEGLSEGFFSEAYETLRHMIRDYEEL